MEKALKPTGKDQIEQVKEEQVKKQRTLVGRLRPKGKNHTLFEFDLKNKVVRKAEFKVEKTIDFESAKSNLKGQRKEVDGKPDCVYISALNEKNAWKKFRKVYNV